MQLSPLAQKAFAVLRSNGRVLTTTNLERLAMIELKGFDLAEDPKDDVWQLTQTASGKVKR